eukprot:Tbor_TRINITY_DN5725_c2_g4::TRINITY_DN5725_c2_g4_i1::g.19607::m.19607
MGNRNKIRDEMEKRSSRWSDVPPTVGHPHSTTSKSENSLSLVSSPANNNDSVFSGGSTIGTHGSIRTGACVALDGPLPREAREIIHQHTGANGDVSDQAEMYARRLLSTHRRVKLYREELNFARQEVSDYRQQLGQSNLIVNSLQTEVAEIDAKIEALVNERQLVEMQIAQQNNKSDRLKTKECESMERVESLRHTIDTIATETQRGQMLLQQLIPNLCIENYA